MDAFALLSRTEGIIPAIESAHAIAGAVAVAKEIGPGGIVLINVSGRGDKDMETAMEWFGLGDKPSDTPTHSIDDVKLVESLSPAVAAAAPTADQEH
jgi:tryptophan synthase beta chain